MSPNSTIWTYVAAVALVAAAVSCSAMSIEAEPVKVTHRNSGPRYDIDDVERTKLTGSNLEQSQPQGSQQPDDAKSMVPPPSPQPSSPGDDSPAEDGTAIGHVAIRRIFLFPMMRPGDWSQQDNAPSAPQPAPEREQENEREPMPSMFAKPFWPFMTPARPSPSSRQDHERVHRPHLFGADEASRPQMGERDDQDKAESGPEREMSPGGAPVFDPIQMMVDLMQQAINSQLAPNFTTDLNKDKADSPGDNSPAESADDRPSVPITDLAKAIRPSAKNESREDIVEIEGKKYLRKTVISRHVGENMVLMTRRLIFVPLNETDLAGTTDTVATSSPTEPPATTAVPVARNTEAPAADKPAPGDAIESKAPNTTADTVSKAPSTPTTDTPTSASPPVSASSEQPTEPSVESVTKPEKSSGAERVPDVVNKAAERLVEEATSPRSAPTPADTGATTEKPVSSSPTLV